VAKGRTLKQPAWLAAHTKHAAPDDWTIQWITSGVTPEQQKLMLKFPPSCVVKANIPLGVPGPGKFGVVVNMDDEFIYVVEAPDGDTKAQCRPEWLEVVGYWHGWTPERVAETLRKSLD
jgi:hypothetical protein